MKRVLRTDLMHEAVLPQYDDADEWGEISSELSNLSRSRSAKSEQ